MFGDFIGKDARMVARTDRTGFADVFARRYTLSVMAADDDTVTFGVRSVDIVPSGRPLLGSEQAHAVVTVLAGEAMKAVLTSAVKSADGGFFETYPDAVVG